MKSRQEQSDLEEATAAAEAMSAAADALSNMEHLLAKSEEASAMLAEAKQQVKIIRAASAALEASTTSDYLVRRVLSACVSYVLE
jgi:regulator of protease activity HflC (stomatin/prohibitin superfamily)